MAQDKPYRFGDVANGHRWTVMGWEPLESSPTQPTTHVAPVVVAEDRPTVHYAVGDEANGHRWTGISWVPIEAAPAVADVRVHSFGDVVDGHRWTIAGWEPVDAARHDVDTVWIHGETGVMRSPSTPPTAGWYPG